MFVRKRVHLYTELLDGVLAMQLLWRTVATNPAKLAGYRFWPDGLTFLKTIQS